MKKALTLSILLCLWTGFAFAQTAMPKLAHKDFGEWYLRDVAVLPDGYVVLADYSRQDAASKYGRFCTSAIWKLNRNFDQVWELKFPEVIMPYYNGIGAIGDRIFIAGFQLSEDQKSETALLTILDSDGNILKHCTYPCAGFHSTEGHQMNALPDGTMAIFGEVFRAYGSPSLPWLLKVDADGNLLWSRLLATGMYHASTTDLIVGADGNLWVTGQGMTTRERMRTGPASGFLARVDVKTGAKLWESLLTEYGPLKPNKLALQPDGQVFAAGRLEAVEVDRKQIMRWSADGRKAQIVAQGDATEGTIADIEAFVGNGSHHYWAVAYKDRHTHVQLLDADGNVVSTQDIGSPHFIRMVPKIGGGVLLLCKNALMWQE